MLSMQDDDVHVVRAQLNKACSCWNRLDMILNGESASPRVCGKFLKAVVQSILLYCSETWALTLTLLTRLDGFQLRCVYRMAKRNKSRQGPGGSWVYPRSADVLEECGLSHMEEYVRQQRQMIVAYVVDRPILVACREGERIRGTLQHKWWWEQEIDLDKLTSDFRGLI